MRKYPLPSSGITALWDDLDQTKAAPYQRPIRDRSHRVRPDRTEEYRQRNERYREQRLAIPFVGVDGEGGNVPDEQMTLFGPSKVRHEYMLLRAGDKVLETGKPLTWYECFDFLAGLPQPAQYVAYFFDYDVTMMIRQLTPERLRRLLRRDRPRMKNGDLLPLDVGPFQIDYLPGKEFKVRKGDGPWTVVQDVGSFYQSSFLSSLDKWEIGTPEERQQVREGKAQRSEFGEMTDDIRFYNALEVRLLERLMGAFRDVCKQLGYLPSRWEGPGLLATAAFRKHQIPRTRELPVVGNGELMRFARSAYYGGRFEIGACGPTPPADQWDINSAYPHFIRQLPCLVHGEWRKLMPEPCQPWSDLYVSKISFRSIEDAHYYGFPVRDKAGAIRFPASGIGWYWSPEIKSVASGGKQSIQFHETWQYYQACDCQPFRFVEGLYNARRRLGKDAIGFVLKLVLNSFYGKMAQSVGTPAYANPIWAGLIPAYTRAALHDVIRSVADDRDVYMLATDGVFCRSGTVDLPVSVELGGWSKTEHPAGMFLIQPGIYFTDNDLSVPKTRGVPQRAIVEHHDEFVDAFGQVLASEDGKAGEVTLTLPTFLGAKTCLHRDNLSMAGMWVDEPRRVSFDWSSKRDVPCASVPFLMGPYRGSEMVETVPYDRLMGVSPEAAIMEALRVLDAEQPDWSQLSLI
jgi:hypothetical protein